MSKQREYHNKKSKKTYHDGRGKEEVVAVKDLDARLTASADYWRVL